MSHLLNHTFSESSCAIFFKSREYKKTTTDSDSTTMSPDPPTMDQTTTDPMTMDLWTICIELTFLAHSEIIFRHLAVPSLGSLNLIPTPQSTSLDARPKKTWTSHSCQKRWKWWKDFKCWIFDADLIPICILFPCRASSNSTPTELTKQANISFWAAQ